jgi:CRP-like cAMP-binding protein
MIIDSFGKNFQTNAHVVKNSLLLLIPAKQIENQIQKNLLLANNFFNEIAAQNKNLINQLVQLKLGNSKQKLGQFLLGISFEKGATKSKNFSLKCDKSVVASYLGMKPETFSRALQKLKIDGEIEVKKNEIILQHEKSLCNYCNEEIATKCGHKKHLSCDLSFTDI